MRIRFAAILGEPPLCLRPRLCLGLCGDQREETLPETRCADADAAAQVRWMFLTPHLEFSIKTLALSSAIHSPFLPNSHPTKTKITKLSKEISWKLGGGAGAGVGCLMEFCDIYLLKSRVREREKEMEGTRLVNDPLTFSTIIYQVTAHCRVREKKESPNGTLTRVSIIFKLNYKMVGLTYSFFGWF